jgi:hypothetical protein
MCRGDRAGDVIGVEPGYEHAVPGPTLLTRLPPAPGATCRPG